MSPKYLYKYRPANDYTLGILESKRIWAPNLDSLNDPFDGSIQFNTEFTEDEYLRMMEKVFEMRPFTQEQKREIIGISLDENKKFRPGAVDRLHKGITSPNQAHKEFGIVCLSEHCDSILMWTHYCSEHKGICLGFDVEEQVSKNPGAFNKVRYMSQYPIIKIPDLYLNGVETAFKSLFTKAEEWSYEDEWRYAIKEGPGLYEYPGKLVEIAFGLRTESTFKNQVKSLTGGMGIVYKQANLSSTQYKMIVQ